MACVQPCYNGLCGFLTLCIWWILGGLEMAIVWYVFGCIFCFIPGIGKSLRRIGCLAFDPLSKKVAIQLLDNECITCCVCENFCNLIWMFTGGLAICIGHTICAIITLPFMLCCIKLAPIHFKLAKVALWPVGVKVIEKRLQSQTNTCLV